MNCVLGLVLLLMTPTLLNGQQGHTPSIDEIVGLRIVSSPKISPNGQFIAYQLRDANWKEDRYISQLWLVDVTTGASFQLTQGKNPSGEAEWSPDSRWLAFITERTSIANDPDTSDEVSSVAPDRDRKGKANRQIWMISSNGGEAWQLTRSKTDVESFHWSKDGKWIAFTANPPKTKAAKEREDRYASYQVHEKDYQQHQLWLANAEVAERNYLPSAGTQLTSNQSLDIRSFDWSTDSASIAFSASGNSLSPYRAEQNIYLIYLQQKNIVHKVVALPGPNDSPMFSPDGKQLAFSTTLGEPNYYYANMHIAMIDVTVCIDKPASVLTEIVDLTSGFDEDARLIGWGPEGIYFAGQQKTNIHLFRVNPISHEMERITSPDSFIVNAPSFTKDFKTVSFVRPDPTHMEELYVSSISPFAPRRLTDSTAQVKDWALGSVEVVSWKTRDSATIEGVLRKPPGFNPAKKYPLLVVIHGGPASSSVPSLFPDDAAYPSQVFLSRGALVLEPNYRGSSGYGAAFRALGVRNLGVGEMWDVLSGVDSLIAKENVDSSRIAAMGWSYGGYISAFLTTHTDRFKAISVGAGISDWTTYYVNTDLTPFARQYLGSMPWDDPEAYAKASPMTTIKQAKTPTLIQQGKKDKRVPVPDSFELYRGLQDQGVPSRLILYPEIGHAIDRPKTQRAVLSANQDWFDFYIWNEPIPPDSPLYGSSEIEQQK